MRRVSILSFILIVLLFFIGSICAETVNANAMPAVSGVTANTTSLGPATSIMVNYTLSNMTNNDVFLRVYDPHYVPVSMVYAGPQNNGTHSIVWNGCYDNGTRVPNGNYLLKIYANNPSLTDEIAKWYILSAPACVAVDPLGVIFVADSDNNAIKAIYPNGTVKKLGSGFSSPYGIALDASGTLYVADTSNQAVKILYPNGTITQLGSGYSYPSGVAVDSLGDVFVGDCGNHVVKVIFPNGTVKQRGSGLTAPRGVCIDHNGNLYVGDSGSNQVKVIYPNNTTRAIGSGFNTPFDVAVDSLGDVYVADENNRAIKVIYPNNTTQAFGGWFNYPMGVFVDAQDNLYIAESNNNTIKVIYHNGTTALLGPSFSRPMGVAIDAGRNVYVGDYGNSAAKVIYPNGTISVLGNGFTYPMGVAADAGGNVYVAASGADQVKEVYTNGTVVQLGYGFKGPEGVAVDPRGNVYVGDTENNATKVIYPNGTVKQLGSGFYLPDGVAVDARGNVYTADYYHSAVKETYPNNTTMAIGAGFRNPESVAVDAIGDVYVADTGNNALKVIYPNGSTAQLDPVYLGDGLHIPRGVGLDDYSGILSIVDGNGIYLYGMQASGPAIPLSVDFTPGASVVSYSIPASMVSGQSYPCNVTMKNTGKLAWTNSDAIGLGAVNDSAGAAAKFGSTRFSLPSGVTVNPNDSYVFNFTLTAPAAGTYYPSWQMVWEGHQWFGQQLVITVNVATAQTANSSIFSYNIPASMTAGQSYPCSVTVKNIGTKSWSSADPISLGALYDSAGTAARFGATRFSLPSGTTVSPGGSYTFSFTLTAPAAGTYYPAWQMVWEGHQWFGQQLVLTVNVVTAATTPDAQIVSYSIPGSMVHSQSYACNVTVKNTGTKSWNSSDPIGLGAVYDSAGSAAKFGANRLNLPSGVTVSPGSSYKFSFTLTAPAAGTYYPAWQMVWDGHQWFGQQLIITVNVS